jgi:uncharacterized protein
MNMKTKLKRFQANQVKIITLIFAFYIFPPIAITVQLIPYSLRFFLLMAITPLLWFIRPSTVMTNHNLGISRHNLTDSIIAIFPLSVILALSTIVAAVANQPRYDNSGLSVGFYLFYVLVSCPFQEFAYRGYLFPALDILPLQKWGRIILATILYSFLHIIYKDVYIIVFTLITGLIWNIHYDKYRNLASVTVSHIILGVLTIRLGLI